MELLTAKQRERKVKDAAVAGKFKAMQLKYPNASRSLIIDEMSRHGGVEGLHSKSGIRSALIRAGVIEV